MSLQRYLDQKPLYYTEIDYTRMSRVYEKIKSKIVYKNIIHIIGTNGKGTTGRFLASALHNLGFSIGHYTSPHIMKFNERIWHNGNNVNNKTLELAHEKLQTLLSEEDAKSLSYFEYTTLLAILVFENCDYIVLEAGLGGEHDATSVFDKILTLVTPIAFDHQAFLGNSIDEIARTKLNAIQKNAIIAKQPLKKVFEVCETLQKEKGISIKGYETYLSLDDIEKSEIIQRELSFAPYLLENLQLAIAALRFLKIEYSPKDFFDAKLFGRFTVFRENIIIDVGHNPLAAKAIYESLYPKKYRLIYNTYEDKEYDEILKILKPVIEIVEIIDVDDSRILDKALLQNKLTQLEVKYQTFHEIDKNQNYLVFGSFSVVEAFLKGYSE